MSDVTHDNLSYRILLDLNSVTVFVFLYPHPKLLDGFEFGLTFNRIQRPLPILLNKQKTISLNKK